MCLSKPPVQRCAVSLDVQIGCGDDGGDLLAMMTVLAVVK
jgi:hypothetical protein